MIQQTSVACLNLSGYTRNKTVRIILGWHFGSLLNYCAYALFGTQHPEIPRILIFRKRIGRHHGLCYLTHCCSTHAVEMCATSMVLLLLLFLGAHHHKAAGLKTKLSKIKMVAKVPYLVTIVLWKETAFPLWRAIQKRWKRNVVSLVSSVMAAVLDVQQTL